MTTNDIIAEESARESKDHGSRVLLVVITLLLVAMLLAMGIAAWLTYHTLNDQARRGTTLAQQLQEACSDKEVDTLEIKKLCTSADKVVKEAPESVNDAEIQEPEIQEPEIQDPEHPNVEIQDPEINDFDFNDPDFNDPERQDPETQEEEVQDGEIQEGEINDEDPNDPEIQDDEVQDPEIQDPEIQDPENDDPDPASPYDFTFTFTIPSQNPAENDVTYTIRCNSGTGECTVTQE